MKKLAAHILLKVLDDLCVRFTLSGVVILARGTSMTWLGCKNIIDDLRVLVCSNKDPESYLPI